MSRRPKTLADTPSPTSYIDYYDSKGKWKKDALVSGALLGKTGATYYISKKLGLGPALHLTEAARVSANLYNAIYNDIITTNWNGPKKMREIMSTGMIQPIHYENNVLSYNFLRISCPPDSKCENGLEMISVGPLQKTLDVSDLQLLTFCQQALGLTEWDAVYLLSAFYIGETKPFSIQKNTGICRHYADPYFRSVRYGPAFSTITAQDPYIKKYAYIADSTYKLGANVPPILQGLVAMHTRFLAMCTLHEIVSGFADESEFIKKREANNQQYFISRMAAAAKGLVWKANKPYKNLYTNLDANRNIFRLYQNTNDIIFSVFFNTPENQQVEKFMKETYGVADYFDVLNQDVKKSIPRKKKNNGRPWWKLWGSQDSQIDPGAPKTGIVNTVVEMLAPVQESVNLDPLKGTAEDIFKKKIKSYNPEKNSLANFLKSADKATIYMFQAVMGTLAAGIAFYVWVKQQHKLTKVNFPKRVKYIDMAEANWNTHKTLRNFSALIRVSRNVPLKQNVKLIIYKHIKTEYQRNELKMLEQETSRPTKLRHWILGVAAYAIMWRYMVKWAQYFYWVMKKAQSNVAKQSTQSDINLTTEGVDLVSNLVGAYNTYKGTDNLATKSAISLAMWATIQASYWSAEMPWSSKKKTSEDDGDDLNKSTLSMIQELGRYVKSIYFSSSMTYVMSALLTLATLRVFPLLMPQRGIPMLANMFSYMEYSAFSVYMLLFGGEMPSTEEGKKKINTEIQRVKGFVNKQVKAEVLRRELTKTEDDKEWMKMAEKEKIRSKLRSKSKLRANLKQKAGGLKKKRSKSRSRSRSKLNPKQETGELKRKKSRSKSRLNPKQETEESKRKRLRSERMRRRQEEIKKGEKNK